MLSVSQFDWLKPAPLLKKNILNFIPKGTLVKRRNQPRIQFGSARVNLISSEWVVRLLKPETGTYESSFATIFVSGVLAEGCGLEIEKTWKSADSILNGRKSHSTKTEIKEGVLYFSHDCSVALRYQFA